MAFVPPARHLLRARDMADARYVEPLGVNDLAVFPSAANRALIPTCVLRAYGRPQRRTFREGKAGPSD